MTTVAKQQRSIVQFLSEIRPEIGRLHGVDADRMARIVLTEIRKNPKLNYSTPESFAGAVLTCAQLGLEPGGATGEAYLVPYDHKRGPLAGKTECQLIVGYQGLSKLFYQHPLSAHLDGQAVHEFDEFDYTYGTKPYLHHRPTRGDRGEIVAYYGVGSLQSGASRFVVLTPDEVKELRGGRVGPKGDIADPQRWMERKTAVRQVLKLLPKSTALSVAVAVDETTVNAREIEGTWQVDADVPAPEVDPETGEVIDAFPEATA